MTKKPKEKKVSIGGQALMEGVMMRAPSSMALAVRSPQCDILIESERIKPKRKAAKIPIIRGMVSFVSSLIVGMRTLMRSAEIAAGDNEDEKIGKGSMAIAVILGVALALGIFFFIPGLISSWVYDHAFKGLNEGVRVLIKSLISGVIRVALFIGYLSLVSLLKDIRRNFMYHGAEHKTINCFEKGLPLTVENVQTCSTRHNRCGTTFMFLVMIVSIIVFAFAEWALVKIIPMKEGWGRNFTFMGIKLLLLPLVAGISYEVLFGFAKLPDNLFSKIVRAPGLGLQRLTTKPPDDGMVEVALAAFNTAYQMDNDPSVKPKKFGEIHISDAKAELIKNLTEIGAEPAEADWMLCYVLDCKRSELSGFRKLSLKETKKLKELAVKRRTMPLDYCLGLSGFYGRNIIVDTRVLIPRMETEILAQQAVAFIKELEETQTARVNALDLCTGSGCIALTLCKETGAKVTAADVSLGALEIAMENLKGTDAEVVMSDLFSNLDGRFFDLIVCNPPYIASGEIDSLAPEVTCQPRLALDGGADGLDFYRKIIPYCKKFLNSAGKIMFEVGYGQAATVSKLLVSVGGFSAAEVVKDLEGMERIVIGE